MLEKGFSDTDNKYVQILKRRPIINRNNSSSNLNKLNSSKFNLINLEKPVIPTTQKLNQIIQNLELNKKGLRKKFFLNVNPQNEIFHLKLKELIQKKNIIEEKKKVYNKVERLDGIKESIKRLIRFKAKYALDESIVKLKIQENNKSPPICRYNPNLEAIRKHVPSPYFEKHNSSNLIKLKNEKERKKEIEKEDIYNNEEEPEEYDDINYNNNKIRNFSNDIISINSYNYKNYRNNRRNNSDLVNSYDNRINYDKKYTHLRVPIHQSNSMEISSPNPKRIKNNISVPIFNKMLSRDKFNYLHNHYYLADYTPNYDAIYSNAYKYKFIDIRLKNKKNKLRKIISCSNPGEEYLLLPVLNK